MTTDKVLDKLAKMKAAQEGEAAIGNQAAADAFAAAINRMLLQHELSIEDIKIKTDDDPIVELLVDLKKYNVPFVRTRVGWQEAIARIVANAHMCQFLVSTGTNYITFVGTKSHTAVAEYAYGVLVDSAARLSWNARNEWWKKECGGVHLKSGNFRGAWLAGFVERIAQRFDEARRQEVREAPIGSSQALMRIDQALVRAKQHIAEKYTRKVAPTAMRGGNYEGRMAGRAAADKMAIGRKGVHGSGPAKQIR